MNEEDVKRFEAYLSQHGLGIAQTNDYLRRLDRKVFVDPSLPEHKEVEEHVSAFLEAFLQELTRVVPDLIVNVVQSGSYYSHLRVGRPYEFDFMLEIPMANVKVKRVDQSVYYCLHLEDMSELQWIEVIGPVSDIFNEGDQGKYLLVSTVMTYVSCLFEDCLTKLVNEWGLVKFEHRQNSPNQEVYMKYHGKAISMDLVPCVHFPLGQEEELPEMKSEIYELVLRIIQLHPDSIKGLAPTGSDLTKPVNMENIIQLVNQSLYLTFRDALYASLSTSVLEKFIFLGINDDWVAVLRLVKYLLQTFHIPPSSVSPPFGHVYSSNEFGYSPAIPSRYVTVQYIQHVILSPLVLKSDIIFTDSVILSFGVISLLHTTRFGGLARVQETAYSGLFTEVDNNAVKCIERKYIEMLFHDENLERIETFLLKAVVENSLDVMCLQSVNNRVKCVQCWGEGVGKILQQYEMEFVTDGYPVKLCYLHEYLEDKSILVYNRQDQSVIVYSRLCCL